MYNFFD
jgi:hypothetical protein